MRTYETTILVHLGKVRADSAGTLASVRAVYEVEGAEFIEFAPWEERRLAYPIKGETNALYLIGYFRAETDSVQRIERRAQLSDIILRQLIVARDGKAYDAIRLQRERAKQKQAEAVAAAESAEGA
jgi:small subunit ribosomal protein S6